MKNIDQYFLNKCSRSTVSKRVRSFSVRLEYQESKAFYFFAFYCLISPQLMTLFYFKIINIIPKMTK